eukprot:jgi/Bigna1/135454/aug1.29_g10162
MMVGFNGDDGDSDAGEGEDGDKDEKGPRQQQQQQQQQQQGNEVSSSTLLQPSSAKHGKAVVAVGTGGDVQENGGRGIVAKNHDGLVNTVPELVIGDFGLSVDTCSDGRLSYGVGTPCYMSPEQTRLRSYGPASDIFSLGIILYEMVADWKTRMERHMAVAELRKSHHVNSAVAKEYPQESRLVLNMTGSDPHRRMDAKALLEDPYVQQ